MDDAKADEILSKYKDGCNVPCWAKQHVAKAIEKINNANREKSNAPKESIALHEKLDQLITEIENF